MDGSRSFHRTMDNNGPLEPYEIRVTPWDNEVFGKDICDQFQNLEAPRNQVPMNYVPKVKAVEDIFKEDAKSAENYANAIDDDDEIKVHGWTGEGVLATIDTWKDAGLPDSLMDNIKKANYVKPRQIQKVAIPLILDNYDITGHAETGSGKTAAYLIPIISAAIEAKANGTLKSEPGHPYALILAPTRELVRQCFEQASKFAHDTGVTVAKAYGEYPTRQNRMEILQGSDILVVSPGRFKHFVDIGVISFNKLRFLVFDEGDHLLSAQFLSDIRPIMQFPSFPQGDRRQTLFFSATFSDEMLELAKEFMRPNAHIFVSNHKNAANKKCDQIFIAPEKSKKFSILVDFLKEELVKADNDVNKFPRTLVFCNTRDYCEKLAMALCFSGINAKPLSGLRAQDLREQAFDEFRANEVSVLLVTDVCARGIDIKDLSIVICFDAPADLDTYIHRAGRTGRITRGRAITYVNPTPRCEQLLKEIQQSCEKSGQIVPESLKAILGSDFFKPAPPKGTDGFVPFPNSVPRNTFMPFATAPAVDMNEPPAADDGKVADDDKNSPAADDGKIAIDAAENNNKIPVAADDASAALATSNDPEIPNAAADEASADLATSDAAANDLEISNA